MSRVASGGNTSNSNRETRSASLRSRVKQRKRKKDLEQLRHTVLAAKQSSRKKSACGPNYRTSKNSLENTLNIFAGIRQKNEDKTQGVKGRRTQKARKKAVCAKKLLPESVIGIFKKGSEGQEVRRLNHHETSNPRVHSELFKLLDGCETSPSSQSLQDNTPKESTSDQDEGRNEGDKLDPSPRHPKANAIKGNSLSDDVSCPKWKSPGEKMEKVIGKGNEVRPNVSDNILRGDVNKRRLFENSHDSDNGEIINFPHMEALGFFPTARKEVLKPDCHVLPKRLPETPIDIDVQSIRRWGRSPAFHYEELCAKILAENFDLYSKQSPTTDPVYKIRRTLSDLYAETYRLRNPPQWSHKSSSHGGTQNSAKLTPKIDGSSSEVQACSSNPISGTFASQSYSRIDQTKPRVESNDTHLTRQWNLWNGDKIVPLPHEIINHAGSHQGKIAHSRKVNIDNGRILTTFGYSHEDEGKVEHNVDRIQVCQEENNEDNSYSYSDGLSPPIGWSAGFENLTHRRNAKHKPTILRKTKARRGVDNRMNGPQFIEKCFRERSPRGKMAKSLSQQNSKGLVTPSVSVQAPDSRPNKPYNSKINYIRAKYKAESRPWLPNHKINTDLEYTKRAAGMIGVIEERENAEQRTPVNNENARNFSTSIPSHVFSKLGNTNQGEEFVRLNTKKRQACSKTTYAEGRNFNHVKPSFCDSPWRFNHALPENNFNRQPIQTDVQAYINSGCEELHPACLSFYGNGGDFSSPLYEPSSMRQGSFVRHNSNTMTNQYNLEPQISELNKVPSMKRQWHPIFQCYPSQCHQLNTDMPFIPMTEPGQSKQNFTASDIGISDAVLQNFRVLSFEEESCNPSISFEKYKPQCVDAPHGHALHLRQPSKYLAVPTINNNGQIPRRIPIYSGAEDPNTLMKTRSSHKVTCCEQQPHVHQKHSSTEKPIQGVPIRRFTSKEKCIQDPHQLRLESGEQEFMNLEKNTNLHSISINHGPNLVADNYNNYSAPPVQTSNCINESKNTKDSHAREILLADGRIGLFVPKHRYYNNRATYHHHPGQNHSVYQSNNYQR